MQVMLLPAETERETPEGFGPFIARLRRKRGLYQRDVAAATGYSQSDISYWENKKEAGYLPKPEVIAALARFYSAPQSEFLRAAGYLTDANAETDVTGDEWITQQEEIGATLTDPRLRTLIESAVESVIARHFPERLKDVTQLG